MNDANESPAASRPDRKADRWVKRGFGIAILLALVTVGYFQLRGPMLGWDDDLDAALAAAKAQGRRVVVFVRKFPATDTTKAMVQTTLFKNEKFLTQKSNCLLVEIYLDRDSSWARKYGVTRTPTMLVIAPDGNDFARRAGMIGETDLPRFVKGELSALPPEPSGGR